MSDLSADSLLSELKDESKHGAVIVDGDVVHALAECAEALKSISLYFKSGNAIPVERATLKYDSPEVMRMIACLARLEDL